MCLKIRALKTKRQDSDDNGGTKKNKKCESFKNDLFFGYEKRESFSNFLIYLQPSTIFFGDGERYWMLNLSIIVYGAYKRTFGYHTRSVWY